MAVKFLSMKEKHNSVLGNKRYGENPFDRKPRGNSILGCRKYFVDKKFHGGEHTDGTNKKSTKMD